MHYLALRRIRKLIDNEDEIILINDLFIFSDSFCEDGSEVGSAPLAHFGSSSVLLFTGSARAASSGSQTELLCTWLPLLISLGEESCRARALLASNICWLFEASVS